MQSFMQRKILFFSVILLIVALAVSCDGQYSGSDLQTCKVTLSPIVEEVKSLSATDDIVLTKYAYTAVPQSKYSGSVSSISDEISIESSDTEYDLEKDFVMGVWKFTVEGKDANGTRYTGTTTVYLDSTENDVTVGMVPVLKLTKNTDTTGNLILKDITAALLSDDAANFYVKIFDASDTSLSTPITTAKIKKDAAYETTSFSGDDGLAIAGTKGSNTTAYNALCNADFTLLPGNYIMVLKYKDTSTIGPCVVAFKIFEEATTTISGSVENGVFSYGDNLVVTFLSSANVSHNNSTFSVSGITVPEEGGTLSYKWFVNGSMDSEAENKNTYEFSETDPGYYCVTCVISYTQEGKVDIVSCSDYITVEHTEN